mmetsp:Transcript_72650/g.135753  ORF Transcript_72650/g.135753 Transcript_72650/m.135753 type:complete len:622 (+) Transcript_72650:92-1957(+)
MLNLAEALLEAWAESKPDACWLQEHRALALLFTLGAHLPGVSSLAARAAQLEALLKQNYLACKAGTLSRRTAGLKDAKGCQVHFLAFWRAYTRMEQLILASENEAAELDEEDGGAENDGCALRELEVIRDKVLTRIEDDKSGGVVTVAELNGMVDAGVPASKLPEFWQAVIQSLQQEATTRELTPEDLSVLLLSWLHDAVMWEHKPAVNLQAAASQPLVLDDSPCSDSQAAADKTMLPDASLHERARVDLASPGGCQKLRNLAATMPATLLTAANLQASLAVGARLPTMGAPALPSRMMTSAALALDREEHLRAAGLLVPPAARPKQLRATCATFQATSRVPYTASSPSNSPAVAQTLRDALIGSNAAVAGSNMVFSPRGRCDTARAASSSEPSPPRSPPASSEEARSQLHGAPPVLHMIEKTDEQAPLLGQASTSGTPEVTPRVGVRGPVQEQFEVCLHIYDVSQKAAIQRLNGLLANKFLPVKLGGVFHAGVEVDGVEWSFGHTAEGTGVSSTERPKNHPHHHFRQTVHLPSTTLSRREINRVISELMDEYQGREYSVLRKNCCHFADDFCQRLGVGRMPGWVYRLARLGARIDCVQRPFLKMRCLSQPTRPLAICEAN